MGDGASKAATQVGQELGAGAQARRPLPSLRSLREALQPEFVPVPALESDGWLQSDGAPALAAYVQRALEIGVAMQRNRSGAAAEQERPKPAALQSPARARASVPPPPPVRKSTPGAGLPLLDAVPSVAARPAPSRGSHAPAPAPFPTGPAPAAPRATRLQRPTSSVQPTAARVAAKQPLPRPDGERELIEVKRQLQLALEHVRVQQAVAAEAEQRARTAEQWVARYSQVHPPARLGKRAQLLRHGGALVVFFIAAFVVGGYFSLLGPVRKRVLMHDAALRELGQSQHQLTQQNQALLQQLAQTSSTAP